MGTPAIEVKMLIATLQDKPGQLYRLAIDLCARFWTWGAPTITAPIIMSPDYLTTEGFAMQWRHEKTQDYPRVKLFSLKRLPHWRGLSIDAPLIFLRYGDLNKQEQHNLDQTVAVSMPFDTETQPPYIRIL